MLILCTCYYASTMYMYYMIPCWYYVHVSTTWYYVHALHGTMLVPSEIHVKVGVMDFRNSVYALPSTITCCDNTMSTVEMVTVN